MAEETQRFRRYGGNLTIEELIKDCRSLEDQVNQMAKTIAALEKRLKAIEDKG